MWRWFGVLTLPGRGEEREGFTKQLLFSSTCPFELTLGDVQKERRREKGFLQRKEGIFAALSGDFLGNHFTNFDIQKPLLIIIITLSSTVSSSSFFPGAGRLDARREPCKRSTC